MCIAPRRQGRKDFFKTLTAEMQSTQRETSRQIAVSSMQYADLNLENAGGGVDLLLLAVLSSVVRIAARC